MSKHYSEKYSRWIHHTKNREMLGGPIEDAATPPPAKRKAKASKKKTEAPASAGGS
jgi:hypothetical protein